MSLKIERPSQDAPVGSLVADRELCLDRNQQRLVEAGSVDSAWLLAAKGTAIPAAEVKRLGLRMHAGRVVQGPEPMPEEPAPEAPAPIMPPESRRSRKKL